VRKKVVGLAHLLVAAALTGCHGATSHEVDGGTAGTGGGGAAGRGGASGAGGGTGGTGGAAGGTGCAAQMAPALFFRDVPPLWTEGTTTRFYWAENGSQNVTIHYAEGDQPVEITHPFKIDATKASNYFDLSAADYYVIGNWDLDGKMAVWGPDIGSTQVAMQTLSRPGAVTAIGAALYFSDDPMGGNPTPGIYEWNVPNPPSPLISYTDLGGTSSLGLMLRTTSEHMLLCDRRQVYLMGLPPSGPPQVLFPNQNNATIVNVRPARPHSVSAGVIVEVEDPNYSPTGRDYYVDITQPSIAPTDLSVATTALAMSSACGSDAIYGGGGVLFNNRYVYEGNGGLFAVDVAANGAVSNIVRLANEPYRYLEVTGNGDLFGGWFDINSVSKWEYYRIGKLGP